MKKVRQEFADTMIEVGTKDPRLVVMVGDVSHGILQKYAQSCPGRYFNIGICEPTIVNLAAGIYRSGLIPVVHTISPFIMERAYEQIKLDFGYQKYGINLITVGGAFDYSQLGCSHHCYSDFSLIGHFKRSNIFCTASPIEFNQLFKSSYDNGEINYFRIVEYSHEVEFTPEQIKVGKAICVKEGKDVTIVAIGRQLKTALDASIQLKETGLDAEILYYPTIKPFDEEAIINSARKTTRILVIEEASAHDGLFNYVLLSTRKLSNIKLTHIAIEDFIYGYGKYEEILERLGFSVHGIIEKVRQMI